MHKMERTRLILSITLLFVQSCSICLPNLNIAVAAQTNITTDQSALLALKSHITSDPQNILTTNWSTTASNICNWVGVTCGVRHLRVVALNLSYMGLTATIPPHLSNLSFLVVLDFTNNSFRGILPLELAGLRRLKLINLGFNNFMGTIPAWFGSFSRLQTFNLFGNQFSGSTPTTIFNLSALQVIDLSNNQLTGSIPKQIGNLTLLKKIYLDSNNFEEIPNEIGTLHQLVELYVEDNALKGTLPVAVFNMSSLTTLTLYGNNLNGNIPDNICQHLPSIHFLNLGRNQFDGPLPSKLWQCKELLELVLEENSFSGSIPKNIGNLTRSIHDIALGINSLTGTIPNEIGYLQNLQFLALGANNLNGSIPSTIFNISMMLILDLSFNQLSGSLPKDIGLGAPNLQQILLGVNKLSGAIPNFISNGSKITTLDLGNNSFTGYIPSTLCALTNLERLILLINNLTIDTSTSEVNTFSCLLNLTNLSHFDLELNPLNIPLPVSFGNLSTSLRYLYLNNCNMTGNIPNDIGNLSSLIDLALGGNQLRGSIPTSLGRLGNLQRLYLADSKLQGYIPYELCQLKDLGELVLSGNQLSGSIPSCLGNLVAALRRLSLQSNLLNSTIPSTLWRLEDILCLDLSSNLLNGPLSEDIGKLKVMIDLNLSHNQLSGSVPSNIGGLQNLVSFSFANNYLEGPIPSSFGDLISLELLDLSKNNLSGVIPKSLETLLHLKDLNFSFNKLEGEIPTSGPFQNITAESFVSNGALCGAARLLVPPCKPNSGRGGTPALKYIIPVIISAILLVNLASVLILRKKKNVEASTETTLPPQLLRIRVSYLDLLRATNEFNESNLLGSGGFGSVYKGTFSDGIDVAIKVLNLQLDGAFKSFDSECEVLSNIRHRNLIQIISCCSQPDFKALVLQYMPHGSLEKWLYCQNPPLNILQRLNIMTNAALALEYLHHGYSVPIVHCDMKPSNILLDADMVAHVADFGIAKLLGGGDSMTRTMTLATIGYMAPEFGMDGIVSTRGDVYSFGIVLMETFTKRKPTDEMFVGEMNIKQWIASSLFPDGAIVEVVDANLIGTENDHDFVSKRDCLSSIIRIALACSAELPEDRITMQDVVVALNKIKIKFLKDSGGVQS